MVIFFITNRSGESATAHFQSLHLKPRLHQRNMLRAIAVNNINYVAEIQATCCEQQATCCRNMLLVARNMLFVRGTRCRATCCAGVNAKRGLMESATNRDDETYDRRQQLLGDI